ncbi:MAG: glycosyltransferase family 4 protein [Bacteroidales bacterium]|nr:glycosyltransferase family 4 protein [Bacteroidales bacterium]
MKKILVIASSYLHIRSFLIPHIEYWKRNGWVVDVASDDDGIAIPYADSKIDIPVKRTPFHPSNVVAIKRLARHLEREHYDIINCHTPIGAMIARLASRQARRNGTKIVYMAHGFHFYNGAPLRNWLLYYTAEKSMARCTDALITINEEDRLNACKFFPEIPRQYHLDGIGYDTKHIGHSDEDEVRCIQEQYGLRKDDFVLLYIARYARHKRHRFLIEAFADIKQNIPQAKLLLLGEGEDMQACCQLAQKLGLNSSVIFAGYQTNISPYLHLADVGVSPSLMEGLPIGLAEKMSVALPVVVSDIRGHRDLINEGQNGMLFAVGSRSELVNKVAYLYNNPAERLRMGIAARESIMKYSVENIKPQFLQILDNELQYIHT